MKQYIKDGVIKFRSQIVLRVPRIIKDKEGNEREKIMQVFNPREDMLFKDGWVEYIAPEVTVEDLIADIESYNASSAVNEFYVGDRAMWLDNTLRDKLFRRLAAESAAGFTDTTLWHDGISYPLKVEQAIQMLYAIEMYASACYDNTQRHLAAVKQLTTIEEVESYDYTTGYPAKLNF